LEFNVSVRLVCIDPNSHLNVWVESLPAVLGRGQSVDIPVIDQFASRSHCELALHDGGLRIRDLGSGNGTFVNGEQTIEACLKCGDTFTVGVSTFRIQFSARSLLRLSSTQEAESLQPSE
jgi:pSer/pThr/pTyr-binding forkhead associated (FHA) protein